MFSSFREDSPLVVSPNDENKIIGDLYRDRVYGGLSNVYHRHVRLFDSPEDVPNRAKFSKSGDRFTAIIRKMLEIFKL